MPYLTKRVGFSAAHHYWSDRFTEQENSQLFGLCANRNGHGHNYKVDITVSGEISPQNGMIINFFDLDPILRRSITEPLEHKHLNLDIPFFKDNIPTLENITLFLWNNLSSELAGQSLGLALLKVIENDDLYVEMDEKHFPMLTLTRKYTFSAAHRLWNEAFTPDENEMQFGPCIRVHGHNYTLEVTIAGAPHPETGMIMNLPDLDGLVKSTLIDKVDHYDLDNDVEMLQGKLSTVENVAEVFFCRMAPLIKPPARLYRIRLYESETNWTDIVSKE